MNPLSHTPILIRAQRRYSEQNLPFPPVPLEFAEQFKETEEGLYSTRAETPSPYCYEFYLDELEAEQIQNYVVFGAAGRGLTSNAMHFYLMNRSIALFLQHPWGNVGQDPTAVIQRMQNDYNLAAQLLTAMTTSTYLQSPQMLVVFQSNLRLESRWALFMPRQPEPINWRQVRHNTLLETMLNQVLS